MNRPGGYPAGPKPPQDVPPVPAGLRQPRSNKKISPARPNPDMSDYQPHRWHYDQLNGWWAHCSCGFSSAAFFLRRAMEKHVRHATEQDLREATIRRLT